MDPDFKTLETRVTFDGRMFRTEVDRVRFPNGNDVNLEIVRHPRSVVLLPMPDPHHIVLVRQYRYPVRQWLWELPAGTLDPGEEPEAAARRECHEEIGRVPRKMELIGAFFATPGYCDEEMLFYRLDGLDEPAGTAHLDEDEIIEPRTFTLADARRMVERGEIADMKTALGLTLLRAGR
ncbi:MAG TPA: NUDIX hydrolase [Vicinamibacterales bacterium]|nr:NUDIX hydrolase [Vicinamibacterales bacterium]